ncbi:MULTISPECIES: alanine/glycine:cation symporter family protein [Anoxybacillus]|uniref:Alanine:cation symporter family protein n=1 Tax=Anoxybacillus flavithermus TaxID=33934 RepID=A0A178TBT4_9BACL|nr:alanine/glycine:cation symporter family protein [Anoxybacillus flavithermus]ASA95912.1 alanine:cation symporter family protein [Anoxybacillus flavithermus]ELK22015.1 Na+/alanine symporter [Anoxybacillus flavithermus TNO-09.006]MBE2906259.1 alanine:cation symporter family protein [Anoxybacillus flavithermus]MBE2908879.1 alanine:cation symporter family protein [Anoxybacillus flavithermus]MBE2911495.1 alanine:cation symporter family protein [Anoxybacillus flavithermus]
MQLLQTIVSFLNNILWSYVLIALLIIVGLYFTFRTKFVQFRYFGEMFRVITEGPEKTGAISSLQAFFMSTASRVGTGNLAGVALAISVGGPGAVFWMWLIALIGGASSFVESTLAQIYKIKDKNGYRGGPAYYIEQGLKKRWLGILFAVLITFSFGLVFNSVQANTITFAFEHAFQMDRIVIGILLTVLTAFIIFGGVHRVAKASSIIVPVMAGLYLLTAFYVVLTNIAELPSVFALILKNAFGVEQAVGGGFGAAIMMGIKRGLFSNEAGMGSAPNAAATAEVSHPVKQGLIQTLGVFVDTLVVCSATAFMILLSGDYMKEGLDGITLTQTALSTHIGEWAQGFVAVSVFLFAYSSIIGNYYYGETNIEFIRSSKVSLLIYRLAVLFMVIWGSVSSIQIVWDLADLFMAFMVVVNLISIFLLGRVAFAALQDYTTQRKQGKNPVFYARNIGMDNQVECWKEEQVEQKKEA